MYIATIFKIFAAFWPFFVHCLFDGEKPVDVIKRHKGITFGLVTSIALFVSLLILVIENNKLRHDYMSLKLTLNREHELALCIRDDARAELINQMLERK